MNGEDKYGSYLRGIFIIIIFGAICFWAIRELVWQNEPSASLGHIIKDKNAAMNKIDPKEVLYEIKDFKKGNKSYFIQWIPGENNSYYNGNKYIIYVLLKNNLTLPIYIDDYAIIKDSLFKEPYVSNFSDSTKELLDGHDSHTSSVKIHYYKDFLSVYKTN
jgi:hypothetical protein